MKTVRNSNGFGIIELMVCTAILSVVLAGIMETTRLSMLQTTTSSVKNSAASVTGMVGQIALSTAACTAAITKTPQSYDGKNTFDQASPVRFDLPDGQAIVNRQDIPAYSLYVRTFEFRNAVLAGTGFDGSKAYFGTFYLGLATKRTLLGPNSFAAHPAASVYLTVSPGGVITACGASMPVLPVAPVVIVPEVDPEFAKGCSMNGGVMSKGNCSFNSSGKGK